MLNFLFPWWVWWVRQLHELASAFENKWHIWKWNLIWSLNCNECFKSWSSENLSSPSSSCSVTNLQLELGSLIDHVSLTASCESVSEHTKRIIRVLQGLLDISVSRKHVSTIFLVSAYIVRRPIVGCVWLQSFVVSKSEIHHKPWSSSPTTATYLVRNEGTDNGAESILQVASHLIALAGMIMKGSEVSCLQLVLLWRYIVSNTIPICKGLKVM